jgi:hypothetical protein
MVISEPTIRVDLLEIIDYTFVWKVGNVMIALCYGRVLSIGFPGRNLVDSLDRLRASLYGKDGVSDGSPHARSQSRLHGFATLYHATWAGVAFRQDMGRGCEVWTW